MGDKPILSEEAIRQFEWVRRKGLANVFLYEPLQAVARREGLTSLAVLSPALHLHLLGNYGRYLKYYGIEWLPPENVEPPPPDAFTANGVARPTRNRPQPKRG